MYKSGEDPVPRAWGSGKRRYKFRTVSEKIILNASIGFSMCVWLHVGTTFVWVTLCPLCKIDLTLFLGVGIEFLLVSIYYLGNKV